MEFKLKGKVIVNDDVVQISDSFRKREFVIEVENERNTDWNDFVKFQLTQDRCDLMNPINPGDELEVSFNIRGRKWEKDGKVNFFNSLEAWRIEKAEQFAPTQEFKESDIQPSGPDEDLPF